MEWTDEGLVLGARRHGEGGSILEAMTRGHGRHLGLVRGSRRHAAALQPGNSLRLTWRARLHEHLGNYAVEPLALRAAAAMSRPLALLGVQLVAAHLRLLPERDPHADLFDTATAIVSDFGEPAEAGERVARFELKVLQALGFGLALDRCALTGDAADLAWVSPRTGRAATRAAGEAYADRLLPLPDFLRNESEPEPPKAADLAAAFRLTEHFFEGRVWRPRGLAPPQGRDAFVGLVLAGAGGERASARPGDVTTS